LVIFKWVGPSFNIPDGLAVQRVGRAPTDYSDQKRGATASRRMEQALAHKGPAARAYCVSWPDSMTSFCRKTGDKFAFHSPMQ
jgi:hypothetical protein